MFIRIGPIESWTDRGYRSKRRSPTIDVPSSSRYDLLIIAARACVCVSCRLAHGYDVSGLLTMCSMFRALCHQLWEIVEDRFPDSRHSAVGSFIFLRFFCPAIVSPEAVDLDVPADSREVRRALLLITKVIQNLANNVKFKEPHMQILNTFLAENIKQVTRFLNDIAVGSSFYTYKRPF